MFTYTHWSSRAVLHTGGTQCKGEMLRSPLNIHDVVKIDKLKPLYIHTSSVNISSILDHDMYTGPTA